MHELLPFIATFFIGMFASFIGSQAGSGGTIIVPFLMFLGLPPHIAIGTHRFSNLIGRTGVIRKYVYSGKTLWKYVVPITIIRTIFGIAGVHILFSLDSAFVSKFVGIFILLPLPFLFMNNVGLKHRVVSPAQKIVGFILLCCLSFWVGIFSPGGLTLLLYLYTFFFGWTFVEAHATRAIPSLLSSVIIFFFFVQQGMVDWHYGIFLAAGSLIGAYIGAHTMLKKGNGWVRMLLMIVVLLSACKLIFFS